MIHRDIDNFLKKRMFGGKTIVIYGPRQAGKTTSILHYLESNDLMEKTISFNGDETSDCKLLADISADRLKNLIGNKSILFIDEAHKIPEIGIILKRAYDSLKNVQVIASGSSSTVLADQIEEPMIGRKFDYTLMPPSFAELAETTSPVEEMKSIEHRLVYGCYPDIVTHPGDETDRIRELGKGYLYKDIFQYEGLKRPELLDRIACALALQIGQEVSYNELGQTVGTDNKTVEKYVDILEKAYIVRRVTSYARNLRNELKKSRKIFFTDCGIRNYVLGDWRPLSVRDPDEAGRLWENYLVSERMKWRLKHEPDTRDFFWRTTDQHEVDLIEESASALRAFEFKWNEKKAKTKIPAAFIKAYPAASCNTVTPTNCLYFLL